MLKKINEWSKIKQKSEEWFEKRRTIITASDVSVIFEVNPFLSKHELLNNKLKETYEEVKNEATEWGEKYEPIARDFYEEMALINGPRKVHEVGLVLHEKYDYLGASPDGVVESLDDKKWWLLEIKCPFKRELGNNYIPKYIWIQIQIQLEVCNIPFCHLFQCKYNEHGILINRQLTIIDRDEDWFNNTAFPIITDFWNFVQKMKTYPTSVNPYPNKNEWHSLKSFTGYLLDDPILDWLSYYRNDPILKKFITYDNEYVDTKNLFLKLFIEKIINFSKKNNKTCEYITELNEKWNESLSSYKFHKTKEALENNVDIIVRPVLLDYKHQTYGIPDLIMKKKVARKFFKSYSTKDNIQLLKKKGYVIIFISLKNNLKSFNKWNRIVKKRYSYYATIINDILKKDNTCITFAGNSSCNTFLADEEINITDCVAWMKNVRQNGKEWLKILEKDDPPIVPELMPNMCNKFDGNWYKIKKVLAEKWGELTLLWYCGVSQRKKAHKKGIYSWKMDNSVNEIIKAMYSDDTPMNTNRKNILSNMINVNRTEDKIFLSKDKGYLTEPYIDTHNALELYIDFEVLSGNDLKYTSRRSMPKEIIYLIGTSWKEENDEVKFKSFAVKNLTSSGEYNMIKEWWKFVKDMEKEHDKVILYHWSAAEERFIKNALKRHNLYRMKDDLNSGFYDLRDLMEMYIESETTIKNVWGFSVKNVAKGLYKYGLLPEIWSDDEKGGEQISGEQLVVSAKNCYKNIEITREDIEKNVKFLSIIAYNRIDCNVLYYLLDFLRKYVYSDNDRQRRKNKRDGLHKRKKKKMKLS